MVSFHEFTSITFSRRSQWLHYAVIVIGAVTVTDSVIPNLLLLKVKCLFACIAQLLWPYIENQLEGRKKEGGICIQKCFGNYKSHGIQELSIIIVFISTRESGWICLCDYCTRTCPPQEPPALPYRAVNKLSP